VNDEYRFLRLKAKFHALARAYVELAKLLAANQADIMSLQHELRAAQAELEKLRQLDRAQRATRDEAAPLN
jgi:hypothetical protein